MTNLERILEGRDINLPAKVHLLKAMVVPVVMYGCESWTIKKAESQRINAFELWCWRRLLRGPMDCSMPGFPVPHNCQSLLKLMSIESVMPSNHLILCHSLLLPPSIFPSIRGFSKELVLHIRWPKYWSFSFSIIPSKDYPGLISFRMNWLDLLAIQGTLKSLLQHHSSKASFLQRSTFFTVQLSHPYMTTGKTIALTRWTFVGKVMSLLFKCYLGWL